MLSLTVLIYFGFLKIIQQKNILKIIGEWAADTSGITSNLVSLPCMNSYAFLVVMYLFRRHGLANE